MVGPGTLAGGARDPGHDELGGRLLSQPPSVEQDIVYVSSVSFAGAELVVNTAEPTVSLHLYIG